MCVCNGTDWCTLNQDCESLGYKQQTCPELAIKCPFDTNYVYCVNCPAKYKYICTGAGYAGGSGTACGEKYSQCTCASGYTWANGVCCSSSYKYTCKGTGYAGGIGIVCGGKYTQCNCESPYTWNDGICSCPAKYKYTCTGTGYSGGSGADCNGKYAKCTCKSGYTWSGSSCTKESSGGGVGSFSCCDDTGWGCVCIEDGTNIAKCSNVWVGYINQGCDPVFTGCSGRGNANFRCK